jgi:hypothetical protein
MEISPSVESENFSGLFLNQITKEIQRSELLRIRQQERANEIRAQHAGNLPIISTPQPSMAQSPIPSWKLGMNQACMLLCLGLAGWWGWVSMLRPRLLEPFLDDRKAACAGKVPKIPKPEIKKSTKHASKTKLSGTRRLAVYSASSSEQICKVWVLD